MKKNLVILTYHLIYNPIKEKPVGYDPTFSIEEEVFERNVLLIKAICDNRHFHNHHILLTFDDGFESDFEIAFPLLEKMNLKALFFLSQENINNENRWNQYKEMLKCGHSIGSHGMTHVPFTRLTEKELFWQFEESKKCIEDKTGSECIDFSFPYGAYNAFVIKIGRLAGYKYFYTTRCSINNTAGANIYHRFQIKSHYSGDYFNNLVNAHGPTISYLKLKSEIGFSLKQLLKRF